MLVFSRQREGDSQRPSPRNDCYLVQRIGFFTIDITDRMPRFVICRFPFFVVRQHHALALHAHEHLVLCFLKVKHGHLLLTEPRSHERGFVYQVCKVCAHEPRGSFCNNKQVHVRGERNVLCVNLEDAIPALDVGHINHDLPVEPARPQQSGVEHVRTVGCGDKDDARVYLEPVHFDEDLVEGLLTLVVAAAEACAALAAHSVDLIDKDDAGRIALGSVEKVTHAGSAHAHEHFDKVGSAHGEKGHARLARNAACKQCFAGSGRSQKQNSFGNLSAQPLELLGILEKLYYLFELGLGFVEACGVGKRVLRPVHCVQFRLALSKREYSLLPSLHLPEHEHPDEHHGKKPEQVAPYHVAPIEFFGQKGVLNIVAVPLLEHGGIQKGKNDGKGPCAGKLLLRHNLGKGARVRDFAMGDGPVYSLKINFQFRYLGIGHGDKRLELGIGESLFLHVAGFLKKSQPEKYHGNDKQPHAERARRLFEIRLLALIACGAAPLDRLVGARALFFLGHIKQKQPPAS